MEPITTATIVISVIFGAVLGFVTISTGDSKIKLGVDAAGAIGLMGFIFLIMPTIAWGAPINEATQQVSDFVVTAVLALVSYAVGDAFGSLGYMAVTGPRG